MKLIHVIVEEDGYHIHIQTHYIFIFIYSLNTYYIPVYQLTNNTILKAPTVF